jgi:hypothetical protein
MKKKCLLAFTATMVLACSALSPVSAEEASYLMGDVNLDGAVTAEDAQLVLKDYTEVFCLNSGILTDVQRQIANVDGETHMMTPMPKTPELQVKMTSDILDAAFILHYYVAAMLDPSTSWEDVLGRNPAVTEEVANYLRTHKLIFDEETGKYIFVER